MRLSADPGDHAMLALVDPALAQYTLTASVTARRLGSHCSSVMAECTAGSYWSGPPSLAVCGLFHVPLKWSWFSAKS